MSCPTPSLLVAASKADVPSILCPPIALMAEAALKDHGAVSIALSGGSLPSFLASLPQAFSDHETACWDKWHVFLADERCVSEDHEDSNTKALKEKFLSQVPIPASQIYKINQSYVSTKADGSSDSAAIAKDYQDILVSALKTYTNGRLDIAILGFGPDGHTCSLFPDHALIQPNQPSDIWVAPVDDSPKPPPQRITLTLPVLTQKTDHIIVCGAGGSKQPIVSKVFTSISNKVEKDGNFQYEGTMAQPPPFPCAMVMPQTSLTWVLDKDALGEESLIGEDKL
ncbi:unnamed protein product [Cylindrotheca closterium]|uniref:6-phosphogluconolactonase n=1 Tax=Cylindrotheca closterium TaxID=2856 RepID=A0AAD2GDQ2_9STRA|nr:unnamed protein product [Cylindrotheca closterium]